MQPFTQEERNELATVMLAVDMRMEVAKKMLMEGQDIVAINSINLAHEVIERLKQEFRQRGY